MNSGQFKKGQHWRLPQPWWNRDWLHREYVELGRSAAEIAGDHFCTQNNILFWLRKHAIPRRSMRQIRKAKHWGAIGPDNPMFGRRGELNPRWKGGLSPARQALYSSAEWRAAARAVKKRDPVCRVCGASGRLEIHHIALFSRAPLLATAVGNLIRVCVPCHRKMLGREHRWSRRLYSLLREQASRVDGC